MPRKSEEPQQYGRDQNDERAQNADMPIFGRRRSRRCGRICAYLQAILAPRKMQPGARLTARAIKLIERLTQLVDVDPNQSVLGRIKIRVLAEDIDRNGNLLWGVSGKGIF